MFFRCTLQQMPTLFVFAKIRQKKRATYRETRCATHFSNKNLFRKGGLKKKASTPKIKQGCGSANETVRQLATPPSFNRRSPTSLKGARASEATIYAHGIECLKCLKKRSSRNYRSFHPLRSCAVGNAEDVRLRFYRQFRLCFTTTDFGGRKGIGLSPYPYAVGVTSFDCERNITTALAPSYHVAARQHITSRLRDISLLSGRN